MYGLDQALGPGMQLWVWPNPDPNRGPYSLNMVYIKIGEKFWDCNPSYRLVCDPAVKPKGQEGKVQKSGTDTRFMVTNKMLYMWPTCVYWLYSALIFGNCFKHYKTVTLAWLSHVKTLPSHYLFMLYGKILTEAVYLIHCRQIEAVNIDRFVPQEVRICAYFDTLLKCVPAHNQSKAHSFLPK